MKYKRQKNDLLIIGIISICTIIITVFLLTLYNNENTPIIINHQLLVQK